MKTSRSHGRGDHLMERLQSAAKSGFTGSLRSNSFTGGLTGSWRCMKPCTTDDIISPVPRAQKQRERRKVRKDPNLEPSNSVKSNSKVSAREDPKDTSFTKDSDQSTVPKEVLKDLVFIKEVQDPTAREDHLLLEHELWRKEGDAEQNGKAVSKSHSDKSNEKLKPTPLKDAQVPKPQDGDVGQLEGKDAVPAPTDLPETESLKHAEPVNSMTISDEDAIKENQRQDSRSHHGQVNGEIRSKSLEDRHEVELPTEEMGKLEEKDAVPTQTGLATAESLEHAGLVNNSTISDEVIGKENEQIEDTSSQPATMNEQVPPTSQPDGHELKPLEDNVGKTEEKDAVHSHHGLSTESLEHPEPVSNAAISDDGVLNGDQYQSTDEPQGEVRESSQTDHSAMQCDPQKESQHANPLKAEGLEELDPGCNTIAAHVEVKHLDSPPAEYLKQFSQDPRAGEGGKSIEILIQYWEEIHRQEDVVSEGKNQRTSSQLSSPKERTTADSTEHLQSNLANISKQSSDNDTAGEKTDISHSESESLHEAEIQEGPSPGEKMQDGKIGKRVHEGSVEDPEECFPNPENLEEFLTKNGYKKGGSYRHGTSIPSPHEQGLAGSACLWDRVYTHDIGEDKSGQLYKDHSLHTQHSHHVGLPHHTNGGEAAAKPEETNAWKLGVLSVPHVLVVGALTALSVLGKAAS